MSNTTTLSLAQLKRAVQIKEQIEKLQAELASALGSTASSQKSRPSSGMSEATKAKLRAASKARWAKIKSGNRPTTSTPKSNAPVRKPMSAAAKARLSALMKARWAAKNKGGGKPASAKQAAPKKKPVISAAGKAKLSALAKARWAKIKAAGKKGF
jgi:hypothetical protein